MMLIAIFVRTKTVFPPIFKVVILVVFILNDIVLHIISKFFFPDIVNIGYWVDVLFGFRKITRIKIDIFFVFSSLAFNREEIQGEFLHDDYVVYNYDSKVQDEVIAKKHVYHDRHEIVVRFVLN